MSLKRQIGNISQGEILMKQEAGSEFSEQLMFPRKYIGALMWHSGTSKSFALTFPVHLKRNCSFWCPDSTMVQLWQPNFFNDDQVELLPPNRHRVMWATLLGLEFDRSQMPNIREMQQKEAKMNIVSGIVVEVNGNVDLPSYFLCAYVLWVEALSHPSFDFIRGI